MQDARSACQIGAGIGSRCKNKQTSLKVLQVREGNFGKDEATCRSLTELTRLTAAAYSIRARSEVYEC